VYLNFNCLNLVYHSVLINTQNFTVAFSFVIKTINVFHIASKFETIITSKLMESPFDVRVDIFQTMKELKEK